MSDSTPSSVKDYDVLIVGAGISGICAAYHLQTACPDLTYRVLESRANLGGTWDLFNYPGIRSDSDMYTFGFSFRPWRSTEDKIIATKEKILEYLHDTVQEYGIDQQIEFHTKVQEANWDSQQAKWTLKVQQTSQTTTTTSSSYFRAKFLFQCTGYYDYEQGYTPDFPNQQAFQGPIIHPQKWPKDLDYSNKRIVVIGSGATAVTLIPSLTCGPKAASHVTMLQRSPTYITTRFSRMTIVARTIERLFGRDAVRTYFIGFSILIYSICKIFPQGMANIFRNIALREIGEDKFDPADFTPRYQPWDQRLCVCPDNDFFHSIKEGKAAIVTDHIVEFTSDGVKTENHNVLPADIIVTATGLKLLIGGNIKFTMDQKPLEIKDHFVYKGFMGDSVPNFFVAVGYTNASWTLKIDLTMKAAARLVKAVQAGGYRYCQAELPMDSKLRKNPEPLIDLTSGYIQRASHMIPHQASEYPWRLYQNYVYDKFALQYTSLRDSAMKFYK